MQPLLHKEYLVNRQTFFIAALMLVIGELITTNSSQLSMRTAMIFSIFQPFINEKNEDLSKSEVLINSLPVTREKIVLSKYLFSIIVTLCYFALTYGINVFVPKFTPNSLGEILLSWVVVALFLTVYYPLFYLLGPRFLTIGMFTLFFLLLGVGYPIMNLGAKNNFWGLKTFLTQFPIIQLGIAALVLSIMLLIISYFLSSKIYKRKEF